MEIEILVESPMITLKSVSWGPKNKEQFRSSQEAIRHAVQNHPQRDVLKEWLTANKHLTVTTEFHLAGQRAHKSDLDSLLSELFNPLVEGACGPRPKGKPIPQTKDALFWEAHAKKVMDDHEHTIVHIRQL
jgi:hypothetical protein